jgi:RHS repeat-associated protein
VTIRIVSGWNPKLAMKLASTEGTPENTETIADALQAYSQSRNEQLFAIVDGAQGEVVLQKLSTSGVRYVSLYKGENYEKLFSVSPILVECPGSGQFLRWLTTDVWGKGFAVFLTSRVSLDELATHFRRLLTVVTTAGEKLLFRFYDPRVLSAYLPTCDAAEIAHFYGRTETFLTEYEDKNFILAFDPGKQVTGTFSVSSGPIDSLGRLIIRQSQMNVLLKQSSQRIRAEQLQAFRRQGYLVTESPCTGDVVLEDAAGGTALISSSPEETVITTAEGRRWRVAFDERDRPISLVDPGGLRIVFDYDREGRIRKVQRGNSCPYELVYDEQGRLVSLKYPDGDSLSLHYEKNRLTGITDRSGMATKCWYHYSGQLSEIVDPLGNKTRLSYAGWDSASKITLPNDDTWSFDFDDEGRLKRFLQNDEEVAVFDISDDGGIVDVKYGDGTFAHFVLEGDRVREATNESGTIKLDYDEWGHLIREEFNGRVVKYLRNPVGSLIGIVTPEGDHLSFIRDKDHRVREVLDWRGEAYLVDYHLNGAMASIVFPNGVETHQETSLVGLPEALQIYSPAIPDGLLASWSWAYDQCDRLTGAAGDGMTRHYDYDHEGRLVQVVTQGRSYPEHYELDANGNRRMDRDYVCQYNGYNQLLKRGADEFRYDGRGNMTEGICPQGKADFRYNSRNQLIEVDTPNGKVTYAYDAFGRRICKRIGKRFTEYTWAGQQLLSETVHESANVQKRDYLFFPERPYPLAIRANGSICYLHLGRRAEPLFMTDLLGRPVWKADYESFGKAAISLAQFPQPWRLAGQYFDEETGLHYSCIRYYDPELGRFLSVDPLFSSGGGTNFYIYCDGDPLNRSDPTGEFIFVPILVGFAIGAVVSGGIEAYRQYKLKGEIDKPWEVVKKAAIGGVIGAVGGGVAAAIETGIGATTLAGIAGARALSGAVSSVVEQCLDSKTKGTRIGLEDFLLNTAIGAGVGILTAGVGDKAVRSVAAGSLKGDLKFASRAGKINRAARFLESNGIPKETRREIIGSFRDDLQVATLDKDTPVVRYYGGVSQARGHYVTNRPVSDPKNSLALPEGNTAERRKKWIIPKGTTVLMGTVASTSDRPGGGEQIYVADDGILSEKRKKRKSRLGT